MQPHPDCDRPRARLDSAAPDARPVRITSLGLARVGACGTHPAVRWCPRTARPLCDGGGLFSVSRVTRAALHAPVQRTRGGRPSVPTATALKGRRDGAHGDGVLWWRLRHAIADALLSGRSHSLCDHGPLLSDSFLKPLGLPGGLGGFGALLLRHVPILMTLRGVEQAPGAVSHQSPACSKSSATHSPAEPHTRRVIHKPGSKGRGPRCCAAAHIMTIFESIIVFSRELHSGAGILPTRGHLIRFTQHDADVRTSFDLRVCRTRTDCAIRLVGAGSLFERGGACVACGVVSRRR